MKRIITVGVFLFLIIITTLAAIFIHCSVTEYKAFATLKLMKQYHFCFREWCIENNCNSNDYRSELNVSDFPYSVHAASDWPERWATSADIRANDDKCPSCILIRYPGLNGEYDTDTYLFETDKYDDIVIVNKELIYAPSEIADDENNYIADAISNMNSGELWFNSFFWWLVSIDTWDDYQRVESIDMREFQRVTIPTLNVNNGAYSCNDNYLDKWGNEILFFRSKQCSNIILLLSKGPNGILDSDGICESMKWDMGMFKRIPKNDDLIIFHTLFFRGMSGVSHMGHWEDMEVYRSYL